MTTYRIVRAGDSRSFPTPHAFVDQADPKGASRVFIGADSGKALQEAGELGACQFVAVELGVECLGTYTGATPLVELVRQPATRDSAIQAARAAFEAAGLKVAICGDFPGRIVDRLIRPYLNAALRRLDERLASAEDMDKTLCLGLGYPEGPISLLERTGLAEHHDVTLALFHALGQEAYAPARRAQVAKAREGR